MKLVPLIVAFLLAGATVEARPTKYDDAPMSRGATVATATTVTGNADDTALAEPGASTYALLALGLFGMGLVARRRGAD